MRKLTKISLILVLIFALHITLYTLHSYAAIPHLINYQGRLTDSSGTPLNGSYQLTFRIYDAETAGNLLWEETYSGAVIQKGIFSVLLGSVTNLDLPFDKPYFLEIKVGNEVMSPRQRITSSGYAIRAETAENALTAQQAQNATRAKNAETAERVQGSENIFLGTGNVGIGTINPSAKLDIQGGVIKLKGITMDYVSGSNPACPGGTAPIAKKWIQQTNSCGPPSCSTCPSCCTTASGWSVNPPTCQYQAPVSYACEGGTCCCNWVTSTFTSNQWTETICMGN